SQPTSVATIERKPAAIPQTGVEARRAIRRGDWNGPTSGLAPGYVQGNLAILPAALAADFMRFCQLNPKPCPLLAAGAPGDPRLPSLGEDLDIRTDLCRYKVFRNGELVDEPTAAAGPFHGPLVVSMRPLKPADAIRAVQITTRFPAVHGAPVHLGMPEQ